MVIPFPACKRHKATTTTGGDHHWWVDKLHHLVNTMILAQNFKSIAFLLFMRNEQLLVMIWGRKIGLGRN